MLGDLENPTGCILLAGPSSPRLVGSIKTNGAVGADGISAPSF